jgi:hypothetical protein
MMCFRQISQFVLHRRKQRRQVSVCLVHLASFAWSSPMGLGAYTNKARCGSESVSLPRIQTFVNRDLDHFDARGVGPLSVLALDLPAPMGGWEAELQRRGVAVGVDDIGRKAVSRRVARLLFTERDEGEARVRESAAQRDRLHELHRQAIPVGVPAALVGYSENPARELVLNGMQADRDSQPRRRSVLEDALDGGGSIDHSVGPAGDG